MKMDHIPIRTCISCRCKKPKFCLLKIVKSKQNTGTLELKLDKNQKLMGRGMYLCYNLKCLENLKKAKNKKKRNVINLDESLLLEIEETIKTFEKQNTGTAWSLQ